MLPTKERVVVLPQLPVMAIAGIGQGISVSIFFWSIHILIYVIAAFF